MTPVIARAVYRWRAATANVAGRVLISALLLSALQATGRVSAADIRLTGVDRGGRFLGIAANPGCTSDDVRIRAGANSDGAGGNMEVMYTLRDAGSRRCMLSGYPGVTLLTGHFVPLRTIVHRGSSYLIDDRPHTVELRPGGLAVFWLSFRDTPSVQSPVCTTVPYILVFLPHSPLPIISYSHAGGAATRPCGSVVAVSSFHPR